MFEERVWGEGSPSDLLHGPVIYSPHVFIVLALSSLLKDFITSGLGKINEKKNNSYLMFVVDVLYI